MSPSYSIHIYFFLTDVSLLNFPRKRIIEAYGIFGCCDINLKKKKDRDRNRANREPGKETDKRIDKETALNVEITVGFLYLFFPPLFPKLTASRESVIFSFFSNQDPRRYNMATQANK